MKKLMVLVLAAALWGCSAQEEKTYRPLVTAITARGTGEAADLYRHYTDGEKMSAVLNKLRLMHPTPAVLKDPQRFVRSGWIITLHFSDGSEKIYHHRADRYLSVDQAPWQTVEPKLGEELARLLSKLPGDVSPP